MAIIKNSRTFEGSELKARTNTYIKSDTRIVTFGKDEKEGVYLFILGSYKEDNAGNGVWYRPLKIRDNFGMGMYKEKFASQPNCPVEYFAAKVQTFAPDMCKSTETVDDKGRKKWTYPAWGRTAWRVLYNAAYYGKFEKGVHVLDLPQNGGASVIDTFVKGRRPNGEPNPMINDYEAAIPVHIKLDLDAKGQPWQISIDASEKFALPEQLADTDYLYNLDDVISYPNKVTLIEKLKTLVPADVFRRGIEGYNDGGVVYEVATAPVQAPPKPHYAQAPVEADDAVPMSYPVVPPTPKAKPVAPTMTIPKSGQKAQVPVQAPAPQPQEAEEVEEHAPLSPTLPSNPMAPTVSVAAAMAKAKAMLSKQG